MVAWWNVQTSNKKSALISLAGIVLSLISLYGIPYLQSSDATWAVFATGAATYLVALAQRNLPKPPDGDAPAPATVSPSLAG